MAALQFDARAFDASRLEKQQPWKFKREKPETEHKPQAVTMCSGFGQHHTNETDPDKPNRKLTPYLTIDLAEIRLMVDNPPSVDKQNARWVIPSSLPSRVFDTQEKNGVYHMMWADIDVDSPGVNAIAEALDFIIGGADFEVYSSRSAKPDNQKCRILVPCIPVKGPEWVIVQEIFNDLILDEGITPDRAAERAAQLCYLPNKGELYESRSRRAGKLFDPLVVWSTLIEKKRQAVEEAARALDEAKKAAAARREAVKYQGEDSPIHAFNDVYTPQEILLQCGYAQRGKHFRHPHSESGSYSASIKADSSGVLRVFSLSSSDPLYTGGAGNGAHDAFGAFSVLYHGGNVESAIKDAGDNWLTINGESWSAVKRREYARRKEAEQLAAVDASGLINKIKQGTTIDTETGEIVAEPGKKLPLLTEVKVWQAEASVQQPDHLDRLPGEKLQRAMEWIQSSAEDTNPTLNVSSAMHLACVVAARRVITNRMNTAALFIGQIAKTGEGKNSGKNAVAKVMTRAFGEMPQANFSSGAAIYSAMRLNPTAVFHVDEFGDKLRHGLKDKSGRMVDAMAALKELFSMPTDILLPNAYSKTGMTQKQMEDFDRTNAPSHKPHLNLLVMTTPGQFHGALTDSMVEGGLLNRFIFTEGCRRIITNEEPEYDPPEWLLEHCRKVRSTLTERIGGNLADLNATNSTVDPEMAKFFFSDRGMAMLNDFKREITELGRNDDFYANVSKRWREVAMRASVALHAFETPEKGEISDQIVRWCIDYVRWHSKRFVAQLYDLAEPSEKYGQRRKAYLKGFRARPQGTSSHEVGKLAPWRHDPPELRSKILADMLASGEIAKVLVDKPPRGPRPEMFVAVAL